MSFNRYNPEVIHSEFLMEEEPSDGVLVTAAGRDAMIMVFLR